MAALSSVAVVALGIGRFSYAMVLPAMRDDLGWSYAQGAVPAVANGLGYLVGAAQAPRLVRRHGQRSVVAWSVAGTAMAVSATAIDPGLIGVCLARLLAGWCGGVAFVTAGAVAIELQARGARRAVLWFPAGAGVGVLGSAVLGSWTGSDPGSWRSAWLLLAAISAVGVTLVAVARAGEVVAPTTTSELARRDWRFPGRGRVLTAYALFGAGYIVFATFAVAVLADRGVGVDGRSTFWGVVGLASLAGTVVWHGPFDRLPGALPLTATTVTASGGVAVFLCWPSMAGAATSAVLFGGSWLATVSAVGQVVRSGLPPSQWTTGMSRLTVAFSAGQFVGPALSMLPTTIGNGQMLIASSGMLLAASAAVAATAPRTRRAGRARLGRASPGGATRT